MHSDAPSSYWISIALHYNGSIVAVIADDGIYVSRNYGLNFTNCMSFAQASHDGNSTQQIAMNHNGSIIVVRIAYSDIYFRSVNLGSTRMQLATSPYAIYGLQTDTTGRFVFSIDNL